MEEKMSFDLKKLQRLMQIPDEELTEEERTDRLYTFLSYLEYLRQEQERQKKDK